MQPILGVSHPRADGADSNQTTPVPDTAPHHQGTPAVTRQASTAAQSFAGLGRRVVPTGRGRTYSSVLNRRLQPLHWRRRQAPRTSTTNESSYPQYGQRAFGVGRPITMIRSPSTVEVAEETTSIDSQ